MGGEWVDGWPRNRACRLQEVSSSRVIVWPGGASNAPVKPRRGFCSQMAYLEASAAQEEAMHLEDRLARAGEAGLLIDSVVNGLLTEAKLRDSAAQQQSGYEPASVGLLKTPEGDGGDKRKAAAAEAATPPAGGADVSWVAPLGTAEQGVEEPQPQRLPSIASLREKREEARRQLAFPPVSPLAADDGAASPPQPQGGGVTREGWPPGKQQNGAAGAVAVRSSSGGPPAGHDR